MTLPAPTYDLVLVLDPQVAEDERAKIVADARTTIAVDGELVRHDDWGERPLSYPIEHRVSGEYHLLQFHSGRPELLSGLDRSLRITDGILRFRIVKLAPGVGEPPDMRGTAPPPKPAEAAPDAPPAPAPPAAETPAAETPAAETPAAETPAADSPAAAETPAADAPAADAPAAAETPAAETAEPAAEAAAPAAEPAPADADGGDSGEVAVGDSA